MAYLVASIIAVVSAMVILLTRYEADDSSIKSEIENMKVMFKMVDGFVNNYLKAEKNISSMNFEVLNNGILLKNSIISPSSGGGKATTMTLPNNDVLWQIIPNYDMDSAGNYPFKDSSYKLLVGMHNNATLMSKARFSESFVAREYCQRMLFGTFELNSNSYNSTDEDFENNGSGTNDDGIFVCIVNKQ